MDKSDKIISKDVENLEKMAFIDVNGAKISIELLESQKYKNVEVIPIKSDEFGKKDFLTLKKGYEMNLVEIKELEHSTVNTVSCKNDAVVPLLLIDSDEITGAMQNRIINDTLLVPAQSTLNIPVSCTEHGRWHYKGKGKEIKRFKPSLYHASHSVRNRKMRANYEDRNYQGEVWDSISDLEERAEFRSVTSSLNDNFEHSKEKQNEYLNNFEIADGQNGIIFIVNGEFKGLELFYNPSIYKEYHEKLCRSYIIEAIIDKNSEENIERLDLMNILEDISRSEFKSSKSIGLGDNIKFANKDGSGSGLLYDDELIHLSFLKEDDIKIII